MTPTVWSGAILVAAAAGLLALRALSRRIRIAFDIVCLIALSVVLHERGASPFLGSSVAPDIAPLWLRLLIAAWWLASARLVVGVLYFALRHDRSHRSAKLVVDLIAAAIYVGTGVIVLKSVLDLPVTGLFATSGVVAIVLGLGAGERARIDAAAWADWVADALARSRGLAVEDQAQDSHESEPAEKDEGAAQERDEQPVAAGGVEAEDAVPRIAAHQ